jgi:hypothetical protein
MSTALTSHRGIVVSIWGKAYVRGANGQWRPLKVGELITAKDQLLTEQDSIVMMIDGKGQLLPVEGVPVNETDRVIAEIEGGNAQAATAAGLAGGDGGGLQPGLRVERLDEGVTPSALVSSLAASGIELGRATESNPLGVSGSDALTAQGDYSVVATAVDAAGNAASASDGGAIAVNIPPLANNDSLSATEDTPVTYSAAQLLGNDSDVDGDALTIASVTSGAGGTAVLNGDGTVTFTPNPNFSSVDRRGWTDTVSTREA